MELELEQELELGIDDEDTLLYLTTLCYGMLACSAAH
jgi:hypothetical protein